jgi:hypothetical protein
MHVNLRVSGHFIYSTIQQITIWAMYFRESSWLKYYTTSRKVGCTIPDEVIGLFNWPNPSSSTMALGSTRPLTEMSTRNLPGGKERPARKADKLTTIYKPIV